MSCCAAFDGQLSTKANAALGAMVKRFFKWIILAAIAGMFAWIMLRRFELSTASQRVANHDQKTNASNSHAGCFGYSGDLYAMIGLPAVAQKLATTMPAACRRIQRRPHTHRSCISMSVGCAYVGDKHRALSLECHNSWRVCASGSRQS